MSGLLKTRINIGFIVNPFYLYCYILFLCNYHLLVGVV